MRKVPVSITLGRGRTVADVRTSGVNSISKVLKDKMELKKENESLKFWREQVELESRYEYCLSRLAGK